MEKKQEKNKLEPCFYCGKKCYFHTELGTDLSTSLKNGDTPTMIMCSVCDYQSKEFDTKAEAVDAHNRVALAVRVAHIGEKSL